VAQTIGQHGVAAFTSPVNGDLLNATVVLSNDNTTRSAYVDHDIDSGIHVQSSLLAARPAAGTAGRKWMTTDTGDVNLWFDTGTAWEEIAYVPSVGGNAATATALQTPRNINGVAFDGTAAITVTAAAGTLSGATLAAGVTASSLTSVGTLGSLTVTNPITGSVTGASGSTTGNAATATALQTARNINGVAFDGTANITLPAATVDASALTGTTLASGVTASSLTSVGTLTALTTSGTTSLATSSGAVSVWGVAYTFPATQGAASTTLTNNGSGALTWSTVATGQFVTVPITSSVNAPYTITTADINKRLQVDAASQGYVQISTNIATFAVGDKVRLAGFGAACQAYINDSADLTYNPNCNGDVLGIVLQSDGRAIIGGSFTTVGGLGHTRVARIETTGIADTTYNTVAAGGSVYAVALQPSDGKAFIGGAFTTVDGAGRTFFARLNTDGTVDTTYATPNLGGGTNVFAVAVQSDDKAIIGGDFLQVGATTRLRAARLNTNSTLDTTFIDPNLNGQINAIAIQSDGNVIITGQFTTAGTLSTARNRIARFDTAGALDLTYNPDANGNVVALAIQSDGKAIIGGFFTTVGGVTRNRLARLNTDGTLDTTYNPNVNSTVNSIKLQSDGKALIGGVFSTIGGVSRSQIGRVNTDGTADTTFIANANTSPTSALAVQSDGKILAGGSFTTIGSITRNRIARLEATSSAVLIRAPYTLPTIQVPQYAVLTLEKATATEWWVTESNVS